MAAAMDERGKVDKSLSADVATVKRVLKQLMGSVNLSVPVQAMLPRGMLIEGAMPASMAFVMDAVKVKSSDGGSKRQKKAVAQGGRKASAAAASSLRFAGASPEETKTEVFSLIISSVVELLGIEGKEVEMNSPLMEMGLDSLATTQLIREHGEKLDV